MDRSLPYHGELRGLLEDIAQLEPLAGPVELKAHWFDTYYWPAQAQSYVNGDDLVAWTGCFNDLELRAMQKFHEVFDALCDQLPGWEVDWKNSPGWQQVAAAAQEALNEFSAAA